MVIPDMGQIILNPNCLIDFINNGGWIFRKVDKFYLYDGTSNSEFIEFDHHIFKVLWFWRVVKEDSGNWAIDESTYNFNQNLNRIVDNIEIEIEDYNLKEKYKHLIRKCKLERITNG